MHSENNYNIIWYHGFNNNSLFAIQSVLGSVSTKMEGNFQVWVNLGDLFSVFDSFTTGKKTYKLKPNTDIQQCVRDRFLEITGFSVDYRLFLSITRTFVNKFKKNNGREKVSVVFQEWFEKYIAVEVKSEIVEKSGFLNNRVLETVPLPEPATPTISSLPTISSPSLTPSVSSVVTLTL